MVNGKMTRMQKRGGGTGNRELGEPGAQHNAAPGGTGGQTGRKMHKNVPKMIPSTPPYGPTERGQLPGEPGGLGCITGSLRYSVRTLLSYHKGSLVREKTVF